MRIVLVCCVFALSACSSAANEPTMVSSVSFSAQGLSTASAGSAVEVVPGYVHTLAVSKFSVGAALSEHAEFGMQKTVGDQGTFATLPSGRIIAVANAGAAARLRGPLATDGVAHNDAVRAYFVNAGLPADQIDSVADFPVVSAGGFGPQTGPVKPTLQWHNSMIRRQIKGIPVPDSYAWARLNEDGVAVEESVYWPPIPTSVVLDAQELATQLADTTQFEGFRAKLLAAGVATGSDGRVCIRHSPGEWGLTSLPNQTFFAVAVYDAGRVGRLGMPAVMHFGADGSPLVLPSEAAGAWGPAGESRKRLQP